MIIHIEKQFKKFSIYLSLGFLGEMIFLLHKPQNYDKYKHDKEYLESFNLIKKDLSISIFPTFFVHLNGVKREWKNNKDLAINFHWLFITIGFNNY